MASLEELLAKIRGVQKPRDPGAIEMDRQFNAAVHPDPFPNRYPGLFQIPSIPGAQEQEDKIAQLGEQHQLPVLQPTPIDRWSGEPLGYSDNEMFLTQKGTPVREPSARDQDYERSLANVKNRIAGQDSGRLAMQEALKELLRGSTTPVR